MAERGGVQICVEEGVEGRRVRVEIRAEGHPGGLVAGGCERDRCGAQLWKRSLEVHGVLMCGIRGFESLRDVGVERCGEGAETVFDVEL